MSEFSSETRLIPGPAGLLETVVDRPPGPVRGLALVAHPHPLFGGTLNNKVTQTLARAFTGLGCVTWRMNFRGVGKSAGNFTQGPGETEDWLALHALAAQETAGVPLLLGGFSFGAFVMTEVARTLPCQRLVLVAPAVGHFPVGTVPPQTLVIHGERDTTVPLTDVLRWAEPQDLPVLVVPGADHFFHQRLILLRNWVSLVCRS
ncbi:alpha/beta hydrolase [Ferrovum sp.]|uniref:alpha/beta hydrolase n=1 Tax=Ferrovum sp. TaxID=2609467 RepID=UPI00260A5A7D|nr:alpha/beta hydrolase [Ferrovum sp.]